MASGSLLMLLDDIAAVADDVAVMAKASAKKTAGVLGDDLALNAQQVTGINSNRELPVVWAVFKGSLLNKLILVPVALLISYFASWLITPLLMIGGAYLCYEGYEKVYETFFHKQKVLAHQEYHKNAIKDESINIVQFEKNKIKGAIRTDFILSAEIIAIVLGIISTQPMVTQILTLSLVAFLVTFFVYGLVAAIVRIDDLGFWLQKKKAKVMKKIGLFFILSTPYIMKTLSFVGTVAMFLVGAGIITHGVTIMDNWLNNFVVSFNAFAPIAKIVMQLVLGLFFGFIIAAGLSFIEATKNKMIKK